MLRDPPALLPLAAGLAVAEVAGPAAVVKWPNDVLLDGRKVAGILAEGRPGEGWAVLGIGVNVAVRRRGAAAGAARHRRHARPGRRPTSSPPSQRLLGALERALALDSGALLEAYRARDALRGHEVAWSGGSGTAAGIDGAGRLVVELADGGRTALSAGEVHLLRWSGRGACEQHHERLRGGAGRAVVLSRVRLVHKARVFATVFGDARGCAL